MATSDLQEMHRYGLVVPVLSLLDWFGKCGCLAGKRSECVCPDITVRKCKSCPQGPSWGGGSGWYQVKVCAAVRDLCQG